MNDNGKPPDTGQCPQCELLRERLENLLDYLRRELEVPISSILGVAGLMQGSGLSGEQAEYLRVIRDAAEGMDMVRRSLGDMAWSDSLVGLGGEGDYDLRVLVHDMVGLFRIHARRRNIRFSARVGDEVPSLVRGVPGIFRRMAGGFLNRALQAPADSTVTFDLNLTGRDANLAGLRLEVSVNAEIVEPDEDFLQLCTELAGRHDGQAGFEAGADFSRFWATLRLPEMKARPASYPPPEPIGGRSFLVVDSDSTWRGVLREYCYLWECPCIEASGWDSALERMRETSDRDETFDFVLVGSNLDEMSMEDFARQVRQTRGGEETILVALPSSARPGDAARMAEAGFAGYLPTPVGQNKLYEALCLLLGARTRGRSVGLVTRHVVAEERKRRKIVMVLDPDSGRRSAMALKLNQGGYVHLAASSAEEALRLMRDNPCALVFIDLDMPDMAGLNVVRSVRDPSRGGDGDVPIVGLTSMAANGDAALASCGVNQILVRPVDTEKLFRVLEKYVQPNEPGGLGLQALDVERLLEQLDHDQEMLSEILHTFLSEGRNRTEEFLAALEKGDVAVAEQKITALRGMAGNIRAEGVRVLAEMAEQACRRSRIDKAASLGAEIMQELWRVEQAVALV